MKYIAIIALVSTLMACSGASSNETVNAAENAFSHLSEARKMLESVNSIDDAKAIEADLAKVAKGYAETMQLMRQSNKGDAETAQELAKITPLIAAEYQGMLLALNALQARNVKAAQVLLDELQAFKTKR